MCSHLSRTGLINSDISTKQSTYHAAIKRNVYYSIHNHFFSSLVIYNERIILGPVSLLWLESEIQVTFFFKVTCYISTFLIKW